MRKVISVLFALVFCLGFSRQVFAQSSDQNLWGIWKLANPNMDEFNILMLFTPNGAWGTQYIEGINYGQYTANGTSFSVNGTSEYVEIHPWQKSFRYEISGNHLRIYDFNGPVEEYVKLTTFTGFGFIPCPATVSSNMFAGAYGQVTFTDGTASRVRSGPGTNYEVVTQLPEGHYFLVVGEPQCADGITWWPINHLTYSQGSSQITGWIGEGEDGVAYIEPIGRVEMSFVRTNAPTESQVVQNLAAQTGAQVFAPGMYGHIAEAATALADGTTGERLSKIMTVLQNGYLIVVKRDFPNASNPVEVVCTAATLSDFGVIPQTGSEPVLVCAFMDEVSYVKIAGPVAGSLFFVAQQLLTPGKVIDPYIVDPINRWADSRPITRFACWVSQGNICPQ